ncbi:MAG: hypothetical protein DMG08_25215 [Acidobacteria bacterium]|nr:MAG: hypothetical protein DMG08_25215 [Acidobacteriota bacterium]PYV00689.1 MAG: hypothetical protein DMG10_20205 [Acidobacteriota bacterium]PYV39116.1 MAG: hypothetical protein DMG09_09985 [Acidobacteriota bacterium]
MIPNAGPKERPSRPGGKIRDPICAVSDTIKAAEGIVHAIFLLPRRCSRLRGETETDLTAKTRRTLRVAKNLLKKEELPEPYYGDPGASANPGAHKETHHES